MKKTFLIVALLALAACSKDNETFDPWGKWTKGNCDRYGNDCKPLCSQYGNCDTSVWGKQDNTVKSCDLFGNCGDAAPAPTAPAGKSCDLYGNCE